MAGTEGPPIGDSPLDPSRGQMDDLLAEFTRLAQQRLVLDILYRAGVFFAALILVSVALHLALPDILELRIGWSSWPWLLLAALSVPLRRWRRQTAQR